MNWGLCVPKSCKGKDIELSLTSAIGNLTEGTGLSVELQVKNEMCQTLPREEKIPVSTIIVL